MLHLYSVLTFSYLGYLLISNYKNKRVYIMKIRLWIIIEKSVLYGL